MKNPNFVLLFIGDGALVPSINKYIENSNKKNVIYAGHFPFSENNLVLNACDIAIVSLNKSMYGLGVPSKSYNNMAAMKPILYFGDKKSEIGRVIKENNIGSRVMYPPINKQKVYDIEEEHKISNMIGLKGLWLPSSNQLTDEQIFKICEVINNYYA